MPAFARAAQALGLEPQAARYSRLESAVEKRKQEKVAHPPVVERSDIMPGVMATRAAWQRVASAGAGVVILAAFLLAASGRWMRGLQARRLSASLVQVLGSSDYRRIIIGGVVIPFLAHSLAEWLIPTASLPDTTDPGLVAALRFGALAAAILTLPALLAFRQLGLHLERLSWSKTSVAAVAASATMTAFAAASGYTLSMPAWVIGWAFVIVLSGVVFINLLFGVLVTPRRDALQFLTWTRSLLPAYATGLLLLAILVPFHHARDKHWTKLNVLTKIEAGVPAMNRYEYQVENQLRNELLELLDAKP
ncbi:hypothetical protein OKA05_09910 [Luteolibacter arcticus]|uniref:Uncharacterized protein n=1 Tax=Luteolibacter arcticus TaxID=1581411 RepID=A0ABT3GHK1_9BACT|nr:hypothetical protein [Luteolibacter arcticus]MCW1922865.1 hypothetical protein [Luteolibacter arcticus]